ncbi:hypothetical protein DC74_6524 [Streptomyces noursei]|nr:hypothetical protein DC74_6524 [Streptomyces noursei]
MPRLCRSDGGRSITRKVMPLVAAVRPGAGVRAGRRGGVVSPPRAGARDRVRRGALGGLHGGFPGGVRAASAARRPAGGHQRVHQDPGEEEQHALVDRGVAGAGHQPEGEAEGDQRERHVAGEAAGADPVAAAGEQEVDLRAGGEEVGDGGREGRDQHQDLEDPAAAGEVVDHGQGAGQHRGGQHPEGRHPAPLGEERGREEAVLGGRVRGLRAHQRPAVERADDGDHRGGRDERSAPVAAEHRVHGVGERCLGVDQLVVRDGAEDRRGAQEVDHGGADGAQDGGPADVALGVADLAGAHRGRLHAHVAVEQDRGRRGQPAQGAAAALVERPELVRVEEEQADDRDEQQRHELQHRGDQLDRADVAGAREVGERRQPQCAQRDHQVDAAGGVAGEEHVDVADGGHRQCGVADPGHGPVRPGGEEPGEVAERLAGVDVGPAGVGMALGEPPEDQGEGDRAEGEDAEGDQADGAEGGDRGRQQEDAAADDVAHDQGGGRQEVHPERSLC